MTTRYACTLQLPLHRVSISVFTNDANSVSELARLKAAQHLMRLKHRFIDMDGVVLLDQRQMESSADYEADSLMPSLLISQ